MRRSDLLYLKLDIHGAAERDFLRKENIVPGARSICKGGISGEHHFRDAGIIFRDGLVGNGVDASELHPRGFGESLRFCGGFLRRELDDFIFFACLSFTVGVMS